MLHLREFVVQVAAHSLRWTVGIEAFRMRRFECLQFEHELIELGIGDFRAVLYII